jgi:hypothetical protein
MKLTKMTVGTELKEIKEMLRKVMRDMTKIRQAQKQMKEEMYEVKNDLKRFRNLWKKEKIEIENRLLKLEEDQVKRELMQRLAHFEKMEEAIEMKEKKSNSDIKGWNIPKSSSLQKNDIQKCIENITRKEQSRESTVNIEYKRLCVNEKNMILKDGQRLIKQFFRSGKTDL